MAYFDIATSEETNYQVLHNSKSSSVSGSENYFVSNQFNLMNSHGLVVEKNHLKQPQYDLFETSLTRTNAFGNYVPAMIRIPTISADDRELAVKKYETNKQKFLGIGRFQFSIIFFTLTIILLISSAIMAFAVFNFIVDQSLMFEWKLFAIIVSGGAILVTLVIMTFLLVYAKLRHEKYKRALLSELKNTDESGNVVKVGNLSRIYKQFRTNEQQNQSPVENLKALISMPPKSQQSSGKQVMCNNKISSTNQFIHSPSSVNFVEIQSQSISGTSESVVGIGSSGMPMTPRRPSFVSEKKLKCKANAAAKMMNRITPIESFY